MLPTLRSARPAPDLKALATLTIQYMQLGLQIVSSFDNHEGFSGVILGEPNGAWHLEFTCIVGHQSKSTDTSDRDDSEPSTRPPTEDNLLVLYLDDDSWTRMVADLRSRISPAATSLPDWLRVHIMNTPWREVEALNPWWNIHGATFQDCDGWHVVLNRGVWLK